MLARARLAAGIAACALACFAGAIAADADQSANVAHPAAAQPSAYAAALSAAALELDAAARESSQRSAPIDVPNVHVPPAPLPGPPRFSPSLDDWLQNALTAARETKNHKERAQMLRDIASSLRQAAALSSAPAAEAGKPVAPTLAAILAQPAYHEAESTSEAQPKKTWWQLFIDWLAGLFEKLFGGLYSVAVNVPWIGQLIVWATLALLAVAVLFVATRLARYLMQTRRARRDDDTGDLLDQPVPADELAHAAHAAAARGDYALAISLLFRAALRRLDAGGIIDYDAARTAGEYRRAVRRACAPAAPPFDSLAQTFTLATYAERPVGATDWTAAGDAYDRFGPALAVTRRERAA